MLCLVFRWDVSPLCYFSSIHSFFQRSSVRVVNPQSCKHITCSKESLPPKSQHWPNCLLPGRQDSARVVWRWGNHFHLQFTVCPDGLRILSAWSIIMFSHFLALLCLLLLLGPGTVIWSTCFYIVFGAEMIFTAISPQFDSFSYFPNFLLNTEAQGNFFLPQTVTEFLKLEGTLSCGVGVQQGTTSLSLHFTHRLQTIPRSGSGGQDNLESWLLTCW